MKKEHAERVRADTKAGLYRYHVPMQGRVAKANASGIATAYYGPAPEGYCWYVERMSTNAPTAATRLDVMVAPEASFNDPAYYRTDFTLSGSDAIADETQPPYVPAGYYLVFRWSGATSGDVCVASIQYAVHEMPPLTEEERLQYLDAIQRAMGDTFQPATAARRAV